MKRGAVHLLIIFGVIAIIAVTASVTVLGREPGPGRTLEYICLRYPNLPGCIRPSPTPTPKPTPTPTLSPSPTASPTSTPTPIGLPAAPTELAAKTNCQWQNGKYTATVPMMWKNNATNADGFKISQRKPNENNWTEIAVLTAQEALDGSYGYYTWTNPEVNTDYLLRVGVFASNISGINWSDDVTLTTTCPQ